MRLSPLPATVTWFLGFAFRLESTLESRKSIASYLRVD